MKAYNSKDIYLSNDEMIKRWQEILEEGMKELANAVDMDCLEDDREERFKTWHPI